MEKFSIFAATESVLKPFLSTEEFNSTFDIFYIESSAELLEKIQTKDYTYLTNSRQISLAKEAYKCLLSAEKALSMDLPVDMVEIDLMNAFNGLGQIIGETYSEEILDNLFANFCVGK